MAEATVGLLRVVLASNTAQFTSGMETAADSVGKFDKDVKTAGRSIAAFSDHTKGAEQPTNLLSGAVGRLAAGFSAALIVDRVIGSIINFGREAFNSAGQLTDLANKTGHSLSMLQEMESAAKQTGSSLQAFTNAAFQLGIRIAGGSDSVVSAVQKLGISYKELRALSPDDQFRLIAERLSTVENAQERNRLGLVLFGRTFAEVAPAIAEGWLKIAENTAKAGDEQIRALDMASQALDKFAVSAKNLAIQLTGGLVIAMRETWNTFKEGQDTALTPFFYAWERLKDAMEAFGLKAQEIPKVQGPANAALKDGSQAAKALTMSWEEMDQVAAKLTASVSKKTTSTRTYTSALREAAPAVQAVYGPSEKLFYLETRSIQETARLTNELTRWAQTNGAVLAPSIRQVSAALEVQSTLVNKMQHQWVQFPGTVQQSTAVAEGGILDFFKRIFGGAEGLGQSITSIFQQAFVGGGGALGAVKSFATQALSAMLGMIPGVGSWVSAFAGPIVAMLSGLARRFTDFFRNIFGGPSADELAGRGAVDAFEDSLHGALNAQQELESQGEDWRRTVIAIRDAYIAAGRTEEEALRDAERLWASSRQGAEEAKRVIEEIRRKMQQLTDDTHVIDIEVRANAPDGATVPDDWRNWRPDYRIPTVPSTTATTSGFMDRSAFRSAPTAPAAGGTTFVMVSVPLDAAGDPRRLANAVISQLPSALETDRSGVATAIEQLMANWNRTYSRG